MALDFNEQIELLRAAQKRGMSPSRAPQSEIDSILEGARLVVGSRKPGESVDDTIVSLARQIVQEDNQRVKRDPKLGARRARELEKMLAAEQLGMDEADMKDAGQILRDQENFGFGDIEEAEIAQGDRDTGARQRELQANRSVAREIERKRRIQGKITPAEVQDLKDARKKIRRAEENQKYFDFGLQGREKIVIVDSEKGPVEMIDPNPDLGVMQQQRTPGGQLITPEMRQAEGRRQKLLDLVEGRGAKAQEERFFRGDLTESEMQNLARLGAGGVQRGPLVSQTPIVGVPTDFPRPEFVPGYNEFREFRPDVVEREVRTINPADVAPQPGAQFPIKTPADLVIEKVVRQDPIIERVARVQPLVEGWHRDGAGKGDEYDIRPQRAMQAHPGVNPTPNTEEIKEGILAQLRGRKERNRQGVIDRIKSANNLQARIDAANALHTPGAFYGMMNVRNTPDVVNLGGVKDKAADMGLRIGNQRVDLGDAIKIRRPDGAIEWFDGTNMEILGDQSFGNKPMRAATFAENLNAPIAGETAESFINRNIYDNFGAQNFGDEGIIENLAERGSGGGIPQVNISGALENLEALVEGKTGVRKGIRSAASLDASMAAVVAAERAKGNVVGLMEGNKIIPSPNAGIGEAMVALKIAPAQQQEIANALFQLEAANRQDINLGGKEAFFGGGRFNQPAEVRVPLIDRNFGPNVGSEAAAELIRGQEANYPGVRINRGLDNPSQGGNRLAIAKDVRFVNKAAAANAAQGRDISPDAAKPFIGRNQEDVVREAAQRKAFKKEHGYNMPRPAAADVQVWKAPGAKKAMDPVEVRIHQEGVNRKNRKGKPYYNDARKKQITTPERKDVEKIRGMQEGNVLAQLRAQRAEAERAAMPRNEGGRVVAGTPVPAALQTQIGQWGRPNITPGQKHPTQELLPRPVRRVERPINSNPEVVQMGAPVAGTEVEGTSASRGSRGYNQVQKQMDLRRAKNRQRRDIGIVSGGVLASILGLDAITRRDDEQEAV